MTDHDFTHYIMTLLIIIITTTTTSIIISSSSSSSSSSHFWHFVSEAEFLYKVLLTLVVLLDHSVHHPHSCILITLLESGCMDAWMHGLFWWMTIKHGFTIKYTSLTCGFWISCQQLIILCLFTQMLGAGFSPAWCRTCSQILVPQSKTPPQCPKRSWISVWRSGLSRLPLSCRCQETKQQKHT